MAKTALFVIMAIVGFTGWRISVGGGGQSHPALSNEERLELQRDNLPADVEPGSPNAVLRRQQRLNQEVLSELRQATADLDYEEGARLLLSRAAVLSRAIAEAERNRTWSHADQRKVLDVLRQELNWAESSADFLSSL